MLQPCQGLGLGADDLKTQGPHSLGEASHVPSTLSAEAQTGHWETLFSGCVTLSGVCRTTVCRGPGPSGHG